MRRILVLASAAAVAMLAFLPLAEAANTSSMGTETQSVAPVKKAHVAKAKKKPVHHKVAAKKTIKKKKPAVKTSAVATTGIQA